MKHLAYLAGASALALISSVSAFAGETIHIQAEEPGSSVYIYAGLFDSVIEKATDLNVEIIPRGGSVANTALTSAGKTEFAFANNLPLKWGLEGILEFEGKPQLNNRLVLSGMQQTYLQTIAATDYVKKTGNTDVRSALTGDDAATVLVEPAGSLNPVVLDIFFKNAGTSLEDMRAKRKVAQVPSSQMGQRVQDGFANAYFGNGTIGNPDVAEVMLTEDMTFLKWNQEDLDGLAPYGFVPSAMPANSYEGQTEEVILPISLNDFIANKDVPDDIVYKVTKAIIENIETLSEANKGFASWDPEEYIQPKYQVIPLHPGAERYYRERGWLK
ncbi:TAXI family TRAP transporter solute-binding subunit [uncultured Cohaesibacter sp.]|uniref:TAXI family TRAP transporter solute-binding subunit n=1 Tax=uncultured Cohaesibacter sp. TaxID=1002546 RepID=UPI0029C95F3B|nr:TAXI family TRAP transporter solute-binding subunit [uncultured Cohaesibacter sp.]